MNRATVMSGIIRSGLTYMSSASLVGMREMKDRKVSEEIIAENIKNFIKQQQHCKLTDPRISINSKQKKIRRQPYPSIS